MYASVIISSLIHSTAFPESLPSVSVYMDVMGIQRMHMPMVGPTEDHRIVGNNSQKRCLIPMEGYLKDPG